MNLKKSDYKPYPGFFDLRIFDLDSKQFFAAWRIQDYLYRTSKQKAYYQKYNPFAWEQIKELSAQFQMFLIPRLKKTKNYDNERTNNMDNMENFIAVKENTEGIIGKFLYYSTSNILVEKNKFQEIGMAFGLPKFKPARESKAGAYRNATTAVKDRVVTKDSGGVHIYRVYCRDNKREDETCIVRELVKETMNSRTNEYRKLANIIFDKQTETVYVENEVYDADVDVTKYCEQAKVLFERFCNCYSTDQVEAVITDQLSRMQANKISIHGNLYFIPNQYLSLLNVLEDYIAAIAKENLNNGMIMSNSMYVVDDERQRQKMTDEFYVNYKRDLEKYQETIQRFIDNGCESKTIIERWTQKIRALQQKKRTYEEVLKRQLDDLNGDYDMLTMQLNELCVRGRTSKDQIPLAA